MTIRTRIISLTAAVAIMCSAIPVSAIADVRDSISSASSALTEAASSTTTAEEEGSSSEPASSSALTDDLDTESEVVLEEPTDINDTGTLILDTESTEKSFPIEVADPSVSPTSNDVPVDIQNTDSNVFSMQVMLDDQELHSGTDNTVDTVWQPGTSKVLNITMRRNLNVPVEEGKKYVLSISTPDLFYFNGMIDTSKITGATQAVLVRNETPALYYASETDKKTLGDFSNYSGEIRVLLDSNTDTIMITDLGMSYDERLLGYGDSVQSVADFIHCKLGVIDESTDLETYTDDDITFVDEVSTSNVDVQTLSSGSGWTLNLYPGRITSGGKELNKQATWYSSIAASSEPYQVYKKFVVQYTIPYLTINGKNYYLSFDPDDDAILNNQNLETGRGYKTSEPVAYDAENHTLTYTFENFYWGQWQVLFYTPTFSWPDDEEIKDYVIKPDETFTANGGNWKVLEQTYYSGAPAVMAADSTFPTSNKVTYIPEDINVTLVSSAEAPDSANISKFVVYKGMTEASGHAGSLGFFDIHNEGGSDSELLQIKYDFNTNPDAKGKYLVNKVVIPIYKMDGSIGVTYELTNGANTVSGTKTLALKDGYKLVDIAQFRTASKVGSDYYFKSFAYNTYLCGGTKYHSEAPHGGNFYSVHNDPGRFAGYISGDVGDSAYATMTISSVDGVSPVNEAGDVSISSTERSEIGENDAVSYGSSNTYIDGKTSVSITAGGTATIRFDASVNAYDRRIAGTKTVNGYHVLRDATYYVCLPKGVEFSDPGQINVYAATQKVYVPCKDVYKVGDEFTDADGVTAQWWEIDVPGVNAYMDEKFYLNATIETNSYMRGVVWPLEYEILVRPDNQPLSAVQYKVTSKLYDSVSDLNASSFASHKALAQYFTDLGETEKLSLVGYNGNNGSVKLNIVRNEACLDVVTTVHTANEEGKDNTTIFESGEDVYYNVAITNTNGGTASDFAFYIPIVKDSSEIDSAYMTTVKDYTLSLQEPVTLTANGIDNILTELYTTDPTVTAANIQNSSITWVEASAITDFFKVTAVKVITINNQIIDETADYNISLKLKYDSSNPDFDTMVGAKDSWRSYGHYTYTREGAVTTNSYPTGVNSIHIGYIGACDTPLVIPMNLGTASSGGFTGTVTLPNKFQFPQTLYIKSATPSDTVSLTTDSPKDVTGNDAEKVFKVDLNINGREHEVLQNSGNTRKWDAAANEEIVINGAAECSKNLTDTDSERYIDVVIGNEDLSITVRVKLSFESYYAVLVPERVEMTSDGSGSDLYTATIPVKIWGVLKDKESVHITSDAPLMTYNSHSAQTEIVGTPKSTWSSSDCKGDGTTEDYRFSANLTPGTWSGVASFHFEIH